MKAPSASWSCAEGTEGVKVNAVIAVLLEDGESADDIGDLARPPAAAPAG